MIRDHGFTLVEMMVVIAILGTMTATAVQLYHTYLPGLMGLKLP